MKHNSSITYRPQIDGLRMCAVLPVILYHFQMIPFISSAGFAGVDVFFVISGFLVNSIILSDILNNRFSFKVFYQRRIRRLFPAMFVLFVSILTIGYFVYQEKKRYQQLLRQVAYALTSSINFHFYARSDNADDGYYGKQSNTWPFLHFWSLAVQQQFYMITPLILMGFSCLFKKKNLLFYVLIYYCVTFVIPFYLSLHYTKKDEMFAFYLLPCRAWQLGIGGLVAILLSSPSVQYISRKFNQVFNRGSFFNNPLAIRIILEIISWTGLVMIFSTYNQLDQKTAHFPGFKALFPCLGTALFILANFIRYQKKNTAYLEKSKDIQQITSILAEKDKKSEENIQQQQKRIVLTSGRLLSLKPFVWVGKISYALYLWHWPVYVLSNYILPMDQLQMTYLNKCYSILLVFVLSQLSTNHIQNPIRSKKFLPSAKLWRYFALTWFLLTFFCFLGMWFQIGKEHTIVSKKIDLEINLEEKQSPEIFQSKQQEIMTRDYDSEGYLIRNPYASLTQKEIKVQMVGKPNNQVPYTQYNLIKDKNDRDTWSPYLVNLKKQEERLCVLALGNSHITHHGQVLQALSLQSNVSFALLAQQLTHLQFWTWNDRQFDEWRLKKIKQLKPRVVFTQIFWKFCKHHPVFTIQKQIANLVEVLLNLEYPPELIVIFGDNPNSKYDPIPKNITEAELLIKKYYEEENQSWKFITQITQRNFRNQAMIQRQVQQIISKNYDPKVVKFFPTKQFLIDPNTGYVQLVGSQVSGQLLYKDRGHLSLFGSRRYQHYFREKVFSKAHEICNTEILPPN